MELFDTKKSTMKKLMCFIFLILLIFICDSPLFMLTTNAMVETMRDWIFIILTATLLVYIFINRIKLSGELLVWVIFMSASAIVTSLISNELIQVYIIYISKLLFAMLLIQIWSFNDFQKTFLSIIRAISIVSLVVYILFQINNGFIDYLPHFEVKSPNGGIREIATVFFTNIYVTSFSAWNIRNFGPFWEPGAFAAYLNLALFFHLFASESKKNLLDIFLIIVTLVTTASLSGIIVLLVLLAIYFISSKKTTKNTGMIVAIFVMALIAMFLIVSNDDFVELFMYRLDGNSSNGSTDSRLYSILGNIYVFANNFLFGTGAQNVDNALNDFYRNIVMGQVSIIHNTTTLLIYFSSFGILWGIFYVRSWYKLCSDISDGRRYLNIFLFITIFLLLSAEDFTLSVFFTIIPMYSFSNKYKFNAQNQGANYKKVNSKIKN